MKGLVIGFVLFMLIVGAAVFTVGHEMVERQKQQALAIQFIAP